VPAFFLVIALPAESLNPLFFLEIRLPTLYRTVANWAELKIVMPPLARVFSRIFANWRISSHPADIL
jgi:hypothetical protein